MKVWVIDYWSNIDEANQIVAVFDSKEKAHNYVKEHEMESYEKWIRFRKDTVEAHNKKMLLLEKEGERIKEEYGVDLGESESFSRSYLLYERQSKLTFDEWINASYSNAYRIMEYDVE